MSPRILAQGSRFPSYSPLLIGRSPLRSLGLSQTPGSGVPPFTPVNSRYGPILRSFPHVVGRNILSQTNGLKSHALRFLNVIDHLANSLQPMNLLPPEMVLRTAIHLIDDAEYYRPLLVATHISRYWRETLLGASSLWTSIDSRHPRLATACIERSNNALLSVRLRSNVSLDFIFTLQSHTARIKTLDVNMPPGDFQRILPHLDPHAMKLESLKALNVQNVSFVSTFFRPTNLSKLSIISSDGPLSVFLDIIATNPHLEEILIVSRVSELQHSSVDIIPLPYLRVLNATLPWHAIKTLLRHVSLPPNAKLIVTTAIQEHGQREFLPTLLPVRPDRLRNLLRIETLTYHYSQVANHQTLCGSSRSDVSQTHSNSYLKGGSFTFTWTAFARFDLVFSPLSLTHVRHLQLNLDCVYSFRDTQVGRADGTNRQYVSSDDGDLHSGWRAVFRSLNQLERLTVVRLKDLIQLVGLLTDRTDPPGPTSQLGVCPNPRRSSEWRNRSVSSPRSALPPTHHKGCGTDPTCPLLQTLEFIECHWLCSQFPALLDFVRCRSHLSSLQDFPVLASCLPLIPHPPTIISPIRRIHIQSCRPSLLPRSQDIQALRELVDTVVTETGPQKGCPPQGVESQCRSEAGGSGRKPPLCVVCGTDLGLS